MGLPRDGIAALVSKQDLETHHVPMTSDERLLIRRVELAESEASNVRRACARSLSRSHKSRSNLLETSKVILGDVPVSAHRPPQTTKLGTCVLRACAAVHADESHSN